MYTKTIEYEDFNGVKRKEDFYFNLTETELKKMNLSVDGGLVQRLEKLQQKIDVPKMVEFFDKLISESYGEKTPDGRGFRKSKELTEDFLSTNAYDALFNELLDDETGEKALDFLFGVMPKKLSDQAKTEYAKLKNA